MNGMNGISPELMQFLASEHHSNLMRQAEAERLGRRARDHRGLRFRIGRSLVQLGEAIGGAPVMPAPERRRRVRTAKADGC